MYLFDWLIEFDCTKFRSASSSSDGWGRLFRYLKYVTIWQHFTHTHSLCFDYMMTIMYWIVGCFRSWYWQNPTRSRLDRYKITGRILSSRRKVSQRAFPWLFKYFLYFFHPLGYAERFHEEHIYSFTQHFSFEFQNKIRLKYELKRCFFSSLLRPGKAKT